MGVNAGTAGETISVTDFFSDYSEKTLDVDSKATLERALQGDPNVSSTVEHG
jgi:hypothetical protein